MVLHLSAEVFDRTGRALFDADYAAPLAARLGVGETTIDAWRDGKSPIPATVCEELSVLVRLRRMLDLEGLEHALSAIAKAPCGRRQVIGRNVNDGMIQLARNHTNADRTSLRRSLDRFTARHGLPTGFVAAHGQTLIVIMSAGLDGPLRKAYVDWFDAECIRFENSPVGTTESGISWPSQELSDRDRGDGVGRRKTGGRAAPEITGELAVGAGGQKPA